MKRYNLILLLVLLNINLIYSQSKGNYNNYQIDGYRPIWFDLGQKSEYGSKYSGGLGTYTVKHNPMAIYAPEVDKTFFVYGGTIDKNERYLLCMIGCYDHKTGMVCKPRVVYDKQGVNDPHDNPALLIDKEGYLWVYVAGRGNHRPGFIYKSVKPYDISKFESTGFKEIMAYPQPRLVEGKGHFLFCTRYDGVRRLFYRTSPDGIHWSDYQQIASIIPQGETKSGHYQVTGQYGNKLVTAFNRHKDGDCDTRTNMYYLQTEDFGKTWTLADGTPIQLPIVEKDSPCRVIDAESKGQNLYIKDVNFDKEKEVNKQIIRVNCTYPGIELMHFCTNDNAKDFWHKCSIKRPMGEVLFWKFIVPIVFKVQNQIGCQYIFLFASDTSQDETLINYYNISLKFEQPDNIGTSKPRYDFCCKFMCQEISKLKENHQEYFNNFNPDDEDIIA